MTRRTTPEKPPTKAEASKAGKGLKTGKLSKNETRSLSARILSERSAAFKTKKK